MLIWLPKFQKCVQTICHGPVELIKVRERGRLTACGGASCLAVFPCSLSQPLCSLRLMEKEMFSPWGTDVRECWNETELSQTFSFIARPIATATHQKWMRKVWLSCGNFILCSSLSLSVESRTLSAAFWKWSWKVTSGKATFAATLLIRVWIRQPVEDSSFKIQPNHCD